MAIRGRKAEVVTDFCFLGSKITADGGCSHVIRRCLHLGRKAMPNLDSVLKSRDITLTIKVHIVKAMVFPVVTYGWELDHEEGRTWKNWCLQTVVLDKTPESPLDSKKIKPVNLKRNQPWILIGRTDAEAEIPVFLLSDMNSKLTGKIPDARKIEGRRKRGNQRMRWLDGITDNNELGQTSGIGEGQRGLVCCSPWGCKESDTTGQLSNNNNSVVTESTVEKTTFLPIVFPLLLKNKLVINIWDYLQLIKSIP